MIEVLNLDTLHWTMSVRTQDIHAAAAKLGTTLRRRQLAMPALMLRFTPMQTVLQAAQVIMPNNALQDLNPSVQASGELPLMAPLFFENKVYAFEFEFKADVLSNGKPTPELVHRMQAIEDAFYFKRSTLQGSINTGNDVGWLRLGLRFWHKGREITHYMSFEVLPTKLALHHDLDQVQTDIHAIYPLWCFSFLQQTDMGFNRGRKPQPNFELLWLAQFASLRNELMSAVKTICNQPHARLMTVNRPVRIDRLHGRLKQRLEEQAGMALTMNALHHRYAKKQAGDDGEHP